MAFRHIFQWLTGFAGPVLVATCLCVSLTVLAESSGADDPKHSDGRGAEKKGNAPTVAEKLEPSLEKAPSALLSELTQQLARAKSDLDSEAFNKIVDAAVKKTDVESKTSREAAEAIKKIFKEERDQLGERPVGELNALLTEELVDRLEKQGNAGAANQSANGRDGKPEQDPKQKEEQEKVRKQLAEVEELGKKLKEAKEKNDEAKQARLDDLKRGGSDKSAGAEPSGGGSGSGDSGSGSGQDSGDEEPRPEPPQNQTAAEKLRALADLLSKSASDTSDSSGPSEDESDFSSSSPSKEKSGLSSAKDLYAEEEPSVEEPAASEPVVQPPANPPEQVAGNTPMPLPAKSSLPTISNNPTTGALNAIGPNANGLDANGMGQGFFGGGASTSTTTTSTSNGFSDVVFSSVGSDMMGLGKKMNYKYIRSQEYGSASGGSSESSQGEGYGASRALMQSAPIYESAASPKENSNQNVFGHLSRAVESLCTSGTLTCTTTMEKQP
jgi:hypothetical protein